jgi:alkaline phosphatase
MHTIIKLIAVGGASVGLATLPLGAQSTIKLLHASDLEGGLDALERAANFAAITELLDGPDTLIISAGDNYIPGPVFDSADDPALQAPLQNAYAFIYGEPAGTFSGITQRTGAVDITIMNLIGFDASAIGNHEFDRGSDTFRSVIEEDGGLTSKSDIAWPGANFPYLSANLDFSGDPFLSGLTTPSILPSGAFTFDPDDLGKFPSAPADSTKIAPATIVSVAGTTVGLVGGTTQNVNDISSPTGTVDTTGGVIDIPALAATIQPVIDALEAAGFDKIIVTTHLQQISREKELALLLSGVDIIIAGGSDTLLANPGTPLNSGDTADDLYPVVTTNADGDPVYIVSTDGEYSYVGFLEATFDPSGVLIGFAADSGPIATENEAAAAILGYADFASLKAATVKDDFVQALIDAIPLADNILVGESTVYLDGRREKVRTEETNLGNLTADANLAAARVIDPTVALSFKNGGGIRADIAAGEISFLDIQNSLRFNNELTLLTLTAEGIAAVFEHAVAESAPGNTPGRFPQVAGVNFAFDYDTTPRLRSLSLKDDYGYTTDVIVEDGVVVGDPDRPVRVVTLNFLAGGGDDYPFDLLGEDVIDTFIGEQTALAEYLKANHGIGSGTPFAYEEVGPGIDDRIQNLAYRSDTANYPAIVDPTTPKLSLLGSYKGLVFDEGAAEIVSYDNGTMRLFSVNADAATVDILSLADPMNPALIGSIDVASDFAETNVEIGPNSVAVKNGLIAVAVERLYVDPVTEDEDHLPGLIALYNTDGDLLDTAPAGYLPDMLTFDPKGKFVVVGNEGEPGDTTDPEGSVTIYDTRRGKATTVSFASLNQQRDELIAAGVRFLNDSATVAQDLEPEYVAINKQGTIAYVACQEANCVIEINLRSKKIIGVSPLGYKDWSSIATGFDASDRDDAINLQPWPALGMYQPDAIDYFEVNGREFLITAGEGDARDSDDFAGDRERLKDSELDPDIFPDWLDEDDAMGRLEISQVKADTDNNGLVDTIWTFGSRSFSLFEIGGKSKGKGKKTGLSLAYDSGSDLELITAALMPTAFNSNNDENDSFDSRSDAKGPEPEAVEIGLVDGRTYAFIGLERIGGVMVYEVSNPDAPQFVQYFNNRDFGVEDVEADLAAAGDLGPECVLFIPAAESPNGANLLVVSNEISGSISVLEFK